MNLSLTATNNLCLSGVQHAQLFEAAVEKL